MSATADIFSLAQQQFDAGRISYLLVADSEKTFIEVERQAIALKGEQILAWIQLMKALGIQREDTSLSASSNGSE